MLVSLVKNKVNAMGEIINMAVFTSGVANGLKILRTYYVAGI